MDYDFIDADKPKTDSQQEHQSSNMKSKREKGNKISQKGGDDSPEIITRIMVKIRNLW